MNTAAGQPAQGGREVRRTTASRAMGPWGPTIAILVASGVGALVASSSTAAAVALLVLGGAAAGAWWGARSTRPLWEAACVPVVPVGAIALLEISIGGGVDSSSAAVLALWEAPLIAVSALARQRRAESLATSPLRPVAAASPQWSAELDAATAGGLAATVIREYLADDEGEAHLQADTLALAAHGYDRVSVERSPGSVAIAAATLAVGVLGGFAPSGDEGGPRIVATFRSRRATSFTPGYRDPTRRFWGALMAVIWFIPSFVLTLLGAAAVQAVDRGWFSGPDWLGPVGILGLWLAVGVVGWKALMRAVDWVRYRGKTG